MQNQILLCKLAGLCGLLFIAGGLVDAGNAFFNNNHEGWIDAASLLMMWIGGSGAGAFAISYALNTDYSES